MNLTHPTAVRALLQDLGIRPSTANGQNFLVDRNILLLLLKAADLQPDDIVLEIGPGLGVLTRELAARARRVIAVEKDTRLCRYLQEEFPESARIQWIAADFLDLDLNALLVPVTKVVSNLPYSSGSRMLVELAAADGPPARMLVTVQQEVAERLAARAGTPAYGLLSVLIQARYAVRIVKSIAPGCFYPQPEVRSALVQLVRLPGAIPSSGEREYFRGLVKCAFGFRRKQMASILRRVPAPYRCPAPASLLARAGLDPRVRPEDLTVADWERLAQALRAEPQPT